MRFSVMRNQEQSENSIGSGLKSKNIWHYAHMWQIAPLVSAWASSVYTYRWWWWSHSYPASNVKQLTHLLFNSIYCFLCLFCDFLLCFCQILGGWSYWCSTGGHSKDQVVVFQADIDQIRRINHLVSGAE